MDDLRQKVQAALLDDSRTRDAAIEILDKNGVVTLSGLVASADASVAAEEIVKNVSGVTSVINEIQVRKVDDDSSFNVSGTLDEDIIVK